MTSEKKAIISSPRDRGDGQRVQNGPLPVGGGKVTEMAALTAAASGLALGAIDMARADDDAFANSIFAKILSDEPEQALDFQEGVPTAEPENLRGDDTAQQTAVSPAVVTDDTNTLIIEQSAIAHKPMPGEEGVTFETATDGPVTENHVAASTPVEATETASSSSGLPIVSERLAEGIAVQISSGIDRIVDGITSGTLQPGFAQDLAGEIVSNVRSMLDEALPSTTDLATSIRADAAETLGNVGDGAGTLLSSPADTLDHLTGRVDAMLADSGLIASSTSPAGEIGSVTAELALLPASVLGGSEGTPGLLGELFYDDGQSVLSHDMAAEVIETATSKVGETSSSVVEQAPLDLGFVGQADLADIQSVSGFLGNSNPLHLV